MLSWSFTLPVPSSKLKDTAMSLSALEQSIAQGKSGLMLSFTVEGTRVSAQLLQSQACSLPGLVSDARTQAQTMADAAGVTLGPILALSGEASSSAAVTSTLSSFLIAVYPPPCALTVKFGLLRFQ
jgi:uncharacterized protein YggE